jgi:hypothetical protein
MSTINEKNQQTEVIVKLVTRLSQVASLLKTKRFQSWFNSTESRFEWATPRLFERLQRDLYFQVESKAEGSEKLAELSEQCLAAAELYASLLPGNTKIRKPELKFTFTADDVAGQIIDFLAEGVEKPSATHVGAQNERFYLFNALSSLAIYARARDTLERSTNNSSFESLLLSLDEDYLLKGYPHDLLAHDAQDVRSGRPDVIAIALKPDYCSTFILTSQAKDSGLSLTGMKVVAIKVSAKHQYAA